MNAQIQQARDVALDILKPSEKDLEHGLELHEQSVVFDSYGFTPTGSFDADKVIAAMKEGASGQEINDLKSKMSMTGYLAGGEELDDIRAAWAASGVTCIFQNAGEEGQDPARMLRRLAHYTYVTDVLRDMLFKAVSPDDVEAAHRDERHCLYFTTNGVPLAQRWETVENELEYIELFFQIGVRMMHVTYNRRNMLGDGCAETANGGLSDLGRAAIAEMNRVGIIVDVAHSGWQTSLEAAGASDVPMVASHSGSYAVKGHYRCKPDEVIRAIADTGGYVGVCCIPRFLGRQGDISTFLDHVEDIARRFGADHVSIGTDTAYTTPGRQKSVARMDRSSPPRRQRFGGHWRPEDTWEKAHEAGKWNTPRQKQSMAWTNWPMFTVGLVQRGFSDQEIKNIIGGNVLRVARAVLPAENAVACTATRGVA